MYLEKFLSHLPHIYHDWEKKSMEPKENKFPQVTGFDSNLLALLSWAVDCLGTAESLVQLGCFRPHTLTAILNNHPHLVVYAVENFTLFDPQGERLEALTEELMQSNFLDQVYLCDQSIEEFWQDFRALDKAEKIGIYFYDAPRDYRSVFLGLLGAKNFLADNSLLIITNCQESSVQLAIKDFLLSHPQAQILLPWRLSNHGIFGLNQVCLLAWQPHLTTHPPLRTQKKILLHVGCGFYRPDALPAEFTEEAWQEIRLDIDPQVKPDMLGTITDLSAVEDDSVAGIYSSHNLEHIYDYEVPIALGEFLRVLQPEGMVMIVVPDMQTAAEWVVRGDMDDEPLYISPGGAVKALWMFYGQGTSLPNQPYMAHKTGFTASSLEARLVQAGFREVQVERRPFEIVASARKKL